MIVTFVLVALALLAAVFFLRLAKARRHQGKAVDLRSRLLPIDIHAFRNLTDPEEDEFLRSQLPPGQFRMIQRERLRAAIAYVWCAARNAAILIQVGESAQHSPEASVAEAGQHLVESAVQLRIFAFQALAKLYLGLLLPGAPIAPAGVAENYERVTRQVFHLGHLQAPERGVTVAS